MSPHDRRVVILMAEDDADDRLLAREALGACGISTDLYFVEDGEELMDYLTRRGKYSEPASSPRPSLLLLDLNMPRKNGRESLREIRSDPRFSNIPVVILTTSQTEEDVQISYEDGANSFITKPVTFDGLIDVMRGLKHYWFEIVAVPREAHS